MIDTFINFFQQEKNKIDYNIIVKKGSNYHVFGQYMICQELNNSITVYKRKDFVAEFSATNAALAWCIADKFNQIELSKNIKHFDENHRRLVDDIGINKKLVERSKKHRENLLLTKLSIKIDRLKYNHIQLKKMIDQAKYLQYKGFYHEDH